MTEAHSALFSFAPFTGQSEKYVTLIKAFSAAHAFRSATVDELVLDDDYHRRPLRPEDFEFLKFSRPVRGEFVSRLPSLASHRLMLSIFELDIARSPQGESQQAWQHFVDFYADDVKTLGARLTPYLEAYAFQYLANDLPAPSATEARSQVTNALRGVLQQESAFWDRTFERLTQKDYLEEGLRFIMVQRWATAPSRQYALARAAASDYFFMVPAELQPALCEDATSEALLRTVAEAVGVTRRQHAYWQFYLPTSMAKCTLLYALGRRPDRAFALMGAAFVAEAEALTFRLALERSCVHLRRAAGVPDTAQAYPGGVAGIQAALVERAGRALVSIMGKYGSAASLQFVEGIAVAERLAERARWDLGEQIRWLSDIDAYCTMARKIHVRIDAECPGIDRDTFVEPLEMCSTTHVHNDHRLVTIEDGDMLFWGNLGMKLEMHKGDTVLIPDGRLHGSTVLSPECTYHQPIIPDDWVQDLLREHEQQTALSA